jgi:hypothetical protein
MKPTVSKEDRIKLRFVTTVFYNRRQHELSLVAMNGYRIHFRQAGDEHVVANLVNDDDVDEILEELNGLNAGTGFSFQMNGNDPHATIITYSRMRVPHSAVISSNRTRSPLDTFPRRR